MSYKTAKYLVDLLRKNGFEVKSRKDLDEVERD